MITGDRRDQNTHYQLFIEKVKKEDGGIYQCAATNIAEEKASIEVNLHRGLYLAFLAVFI